MGNVQRQLSPSGPRHCHDNRTIWTHAVWQVKAAFHDTDIDIDIAASILARMSVSVSMSMSVVECGFI